VWLVPRQVAELREAGYFEPYNRLDSEGSARLRGRVLEAWVGQPVPGVELEFTRLPCGEARDDPHAAWNKSAPFEVRSDEEGRFDVGVAPGLYSVSVASAAYHAQPLSRIFVGRQAQIPSEAVVVVHPLCDLTVELVDGAGAPLRDAEVFVRGGDPGRAFYGLRPPGMMATNARGRSPLRSWCGPATVRYVALAGSTRRFMDRQIELLPETELVKFTLDEIEAAPQKSTDPTTVHDRRSNTPWTLKIPSEPEPTDLESWGRVTAVVVDPQGAPIDAMMCLDSLDYMELPFQRGARFGNAIGFSQEGGGLTINPVGPGRYRVVLFTPDQPIRTLETFTQERDRDTDLGTIVVHPLPSASATGTVLGPDGPIGGAEVYVVAIQDLHRLFVSFARLEWTPRTLTAPDGSYRLDHLPLGDVVIVAYHAGVGVSPPTTVSVEGELSLDLHLLPGTVDRRTGWADGCLIGVDLRGAFVIGVIEETHARASGMLPADRLVYVDDIPVRWMERTRLYALLSGEERSPPRTVTVERQGEEDLLVLNWAEF